MKILSIGFLFMSVLALGFAFSKESKSSKDTVILRQGNFVLFSGRVDSKSAAAAQTELAKISSQLSPSDNIYLVIDSPGGSVTAGNQFIDFAQSIPQKVKTISIFAASMGYHMSQSFDERLVIKSTTLMSHRASLGGVSGQIPGEIDSRLNNIRQVLEEMDTFVSKRVGISLEEYKKLIHNELWLTGQEAIKKNHADRLVKAVCAPELMEGSREEMLMTIFGPIKVSFSNCPLITGPLTIKFGQQAVPGITTDMLTREVMKARRGVVMEF
jgi:ATP-dependent Clp protease protease subunit